MQAKLIILFLFFATGKLLAQSPCNTVTVSACIDLKTELHVKSGILSWVHNGVAPGSDPNCEGSITVNDKVWKDWSAPFPLGFNTYSCSVKVNPLLTNEISKLQQFPNEKNEFETIWFFGDPESPGAHRYIIAMEFCPLKSSIKTIESKKENTKQNENKPEVKKELYASTYSILFESGSTVLTSTAKSELNKIAEVLSSSNTLAEIVSYSNNAAKSKLSEERSFAICNYLIGKSVEASKLHYISFGEAKPITTVHSKKIEIRIMDK